MRAAEQHHIEMERASDGRYVPYTSLLATGRAIRYRHRGNGWWLELQLAGEQGGDADPKQNRSFYLAYDTEQLARRNGDHLITMLRRMHHRGRINTDTKYNLIIRSVAEAAKSSIESRNERITEHAEQVARDAARPSLAELLRRRSGTDDDGGTD